MENILPKVYIARRGEPDKYNPVGKSYSGVLYRVRFSVNETIAIYGVSFYGLHHNFQNEKTDIIIGFSIQDNDTGEYIYPLAYFKKECTKNQEFTLKFGSPVKIPRNRAINIGFQLDPVNVEQDGSYDPDLMPIFEHLPETKCRFREVKKAELCVTFTFYESASQLSEIYFEKLQEEKNSDEELSQTNSCMDTMSCSIM